MSEIWQTLIDIVTHDTTGKWVRAGLIVVVGAIVATLAARALRRLRDHDGNPPQSMVLLSRLAFLTIVGLSLVLALREVGFDPALLLGTAGILTVAIGFASQTSASNVISGIFLIGERPFKIGDMIRLGQTTGEVLSIDLLSVKLRTFDNIYVRVPNETLIKSEIHTLTHFPIRRIDLQLAVAYEEDLARVRDVLLDVARDNPVCLIEPQPLIIFNGLGDSSQKLQFSVWATRERFLEARNTLHEDVLSAFKNSDIAIPFPQRTVHIADGNRDEVVAAAALAGADDAIGPEQVSP